MSRWRWSAFGGRQVTSEQFIRAISGLPPGPTPAPSPWRPAADLGLGLGLLGVASDTARPPARTGSSCSRPVRVLRTRGARVRYSASTLDSATGSFAAAGHRLVLPTPASLASAVDRLRPGQLRCHRPVPSGGRANSVRAASCWMIRFDAGPSNSGILDLVRSLPGCWPRRQQPPAGPRPLQDEVRVGRWPPGSGDAAAGTSWSRAGRPCRPVDRAGCRVGGALTQFAVDLLLQLRPWSCASSSFSSRSFFTLPLPLDERSRMYVLASSTASTIASARPPGWSPSMAIRRMISAPSE